MDAVGEAPKRSRTLVYARCDDYYKESKEKKHRRSRRALLGKNEIVVQTYDIGSEDWPDYEPSKAVQASLQDVSKAVYSETPRHHGAILDCIPIRGKDNLKN